MERSTGERWTGMPPLDAWRNHVDGTRAHSVVPYNLNRILASGHRLNGFELPDRMKMGFITSLVSLGSISSGAIAGSICRRRCAARRPAGGSAMTAIGWSASAASTWRWWRTPTAAYAISRCGGGPATSRLTTSVAPTVREMSGRDEETALTAEPGNADGTTAERVWRHAAKPSGTATPVAPTLPRSAE